MLASLLFAGILNTNVYICTPVEKGNGPTEITLIKTALHYQAKFDWQSNSYSVDLTAGGGNELIGYTGKYMVVLTQYADGKIQFSIMDTDTVEWVVDQYVDCNRPFGTFNLPNEVRGIRGTQ